jgi:hypothetical protein
MRADNRRSERGCPDHSPFETIWVGSQSFSYSEGRPIQRRFQERSIH